MKFFKRNGINHCKEKPHPLPFYKPADMAIKRIMIMRLNLLAVFLLFTIMNVSARAYAQKVTLSKSNAPLKSVLLEIKKQTGLELWYNNKHLKGSKTVSINIKNATVTEALEECFEGQQLTYEILEGTIVVKPKTSASKDKSPAAKKVVPIRGKVVDKNNQPISGVTVTVKGTIQSVITNNEGVFNIDVPTDKAVLLFSYVGYETYEQPVGDQMMLIVVLKEAASQLDQVQVIGYGTTTQRLNTGSVSTVKAVDIEKQPVSNPLATLQGRVPGLVITQTNGVPGSSFNVQIRGQSSLDLTLSQNNPLFIIDGVPFEPGNAATNQINAAANNPISVSTGGLSPLNSINPQDIESIDVLKDADATSIYGSRGANGVILITTKKGKPGKTIFDININSGFSRVDNTMDMLNTQQYVQMRKEAFANDGFTPTTNPDDPGFAPDIMLWDTTRYTDFKDLLIGNTAQSNNMRISVSGGSTQTQFRIGANYHRETTVYPGNFSDNIASLNFNINHSTLDKKFNVVLSGMYSSDKNKMPRYDLTRYINLPPNLRLHNDSGGLSWDENGVVYNTLNDIINPLSLLEQKYQSLNENLSGNLNVSYMLLPGLVIRTNVGYNTFSTDEITTQPKAAIDPYWAADILPSTEFAYSINRNWIIEPQLSYNLETTKGTLNMILGNTLQDKSGKRNYMTGSRYTSDLLLNSIAAAGTITASNDQVQYRYTAFFGRINYNYQDKYIVNLSARRDGSSRFGPEQQWANFGAVGVAWLFSNESFIQKSLPFLSYGKIRGSYGTTGNDQIGDYKFLNLWSSTANSYDGLSGLFPSSPYNPNYSWEINKKFEAGVETGFVRDRILLSAVYYNNRCNNQLIRYVLPTQTGFSSVVKNFPGLVQNSGIEVTMTTQNLRSDNLNWSTAFNVSFPKNKLVSFPGLNNSSYKTRYVEGEPLSILRGFKYLGVDAQTGVYTFEDVNQDGVIYEGDYQYFGNTDPKFYGGLQNNVRYKNLDLSFFFQFTKQSGLNYVSQLATTVPGRLSNQPVAVLNRWQTPGDQSDIQKFTSSFDGPASTAISALSISDGTYTDASFVKLKNVALSYHLPTQFVNRYHLGACRVFLEAQNLLTVTNYKGADPENQNFYMLPPLKTIVAGIQLNF